eukprot:CAMPEP_0196580070 /NCGR_PEP_ID=MMETSP1081-20130531/26808_1 /TAXON_ID=36882 /ORGANISM="Pyramimonas amylifera, Strain CCMP720" /LENGTH=298 /DNA_ID=CAMNT_0041899843 /DNA_START=70 /DNA_END=966 /DNA_ORIENTATION=+
MGKGTLFVPVRDSEKSWREGHGDGGEQDAAHRAFDNPHTLHRGQQVQAGHRDDGSQVKRGAPTMIRNEKGQWVKPDKETLKRMKEEWEAEQARLGKERIERSRSSKNSKSVLEDDLPRVTQSFRSCSGDDYIPTKTWEGCRPGYVFGTSEKATGYHMIKFKELSMLLLSNGQKKVTKIIAHGADLEAWIETAEGPYHDQGLVNGRDLARGKGQVRGKRLRIAALAVTAVNEGEAVAEVGDRDARNTDAERPSANKIVEVVRESTKAEKERAALERLMAARASGQGGRPGGITRPGWGR